LEGEERRIRVVLVDDSPRTLTNLGKLLGFEPDVEVVGVGLTGREGIDQARRLSPDVVLLDATLPDMDGVEAAGMLATHLPAVRVVLLSMREDQEFARQAERAGARAFLVKPFSADDLVSTVRRVVANGSNGHGRRRGGAARDEPGTQRLPVVKARSAQVAELPTQPVRTQRAALAVAAAEAPASETDPAAEVAAAPSAAGPPAVEPSEAELAEEAEAAVPEPPPIKQKSGTGAVTVVFGGKGGVGKSSVAVNLAAALVRDSGADVALVDLDLQFGDLAVMLGLEPPGTLADVARAYPDINASLIGSYMPVAPGGVRVLAAPLSPELADLVRPEHVSATIDLLRAAFDHVIVDTASHLNDISLEALERADKVLLVTDLSIAAIKDTKLVFKLFDSLNMRRDRIQLVLNRSTAPATVTVAQLESNLRHPIAAAIPSDAKLALRSMQQAAPFVELVPDSQPSQRLRELARSLVPAASAQSASARRAARRKFWARPSAV
jgi:Flp pilus assembly CpaE family ATPase/DNA-binding NarL/FixJ family response regulator